MENTRATGEESGIQSTNAASWPAAVDRIPPELWSAIFTHSLPTSYRPPYKSTRLDHPLLRYPPLIPLILASVCRTWREVACGTPQLWENCWLSYSHPELNSLWLGRAGTRLLNLYGQRPSGVAYHWDGTTRAIASDAFLCSIIPYRSRWKMVDIDTGPFHGSQPKDGVLFTSAPDALALETLDVGGFPSFPMPCPLSPVWVQSLVPRAHSLRVLKLCNVYNPHITRHAFPHLNDLQLHNAYADDILNILKEFPQLQRLSVTIDHRRRLQDPPHIIHNSITHLYISDAVYHPSWDEDWDTEGCILDYLTLPSLCLFHAEGSGESQFLSLLDRSGCRITDLKWTSDWDHEGMALVAVLEHNAVDFWLESLELNHRRLSLPLIKILQYDPASPHLIYLERLVLRSCNSDYLGNGLLADAIASRCGEFTCVYEDGELGVVHRNVRLQHFFAKFCANCGEYLEDELPYILPLSAPLNQAGEAWGGEIIWCQQSYGKCKEVTNSVRFSLGEPESGVYLDGDLS